MSEQLFIRFNDEQSIEWGLTDFEQQPQEFIERGQLLLEDLEAILEVAQNKKITVLLPAKNIRCFNIQVPTKNRKHLTKAIPFLLEEQLVESIDSQHFAMGKVEQDIAQVNVVDKQYLQQVLAAFQQAGIEPDEVISEAACLPVFDDAWSLLVAENCLVRQNTNDYFSCEAELGKEILQWNLQQQLDQEVDSNEQVAISQAIRLYSEAGHSELLQGVSGFAVQQFAVEDKFFWLASQSQNFSINLLQQEFASKKKNQQDLGYWKISAIAASILVAVGFIYLISYLFTLQSKKSDLEEQLLSYIQQVRPNAEDVSSGLYHLDSSYRQIGQGGTGLGFLHNLELVSNNINSDQLNFDQLEYLAKRSELSFDVSAQTYAQLTQSQASLEKAGLKVDMRNASESAGQWNARMVIKVNQ